MNKRALGADVLLLLTAGIWGFGFVAQRSGMEYIGPFAFNGIRFLLGSLSLLPLITWRNREKPKPGVSGIRNPVFASFAAGTCLFFAVTLQQLGIMFTTAGNAGFITGLYVVLTPIFGIFLGKKTGPATWVGAVFTLTGLYFLSAAGSMDASDPLGSLNPGDIITAVSAVFWAVHVLIIDQLVRNTDPIVLSSGQFAFCGVYSLIAAFAVEPFLGSQVETLAKALPGGLFGWKPLPGLIGGFTSGTIPLTFISNALIPILYGGLASVGIAYTLQVVAQRDAPPAHATIILCLEGCFAALGGVLLLHEPLGTWTVLGFVLMLTGMLSSQWEVIAGYQNKAV
ncbi:MAG: DMT family transporter [Treponema sp.]|jgi:drug/metabolite transporter (DMT)-like permease|nr:DMT family transporter [Treponema sp.]